MKRFGRKIARGFSGPLTEYGFTPYGRNIDDMGECHGMGVAIEGGTSLKQLGDFSDLGGVLGAGEPTLRKGSRGADVVKLQNRLMELGYSLPNYGADGDFGGETYNAVIQFQRDKGLSTDGIVGPATWAALSPSAGVSQPITTSTPKSTAVPSPTTTIKKDKFLGMPKMAAMIGIPSLIGIPLIAILIKKFKKR